MSGQSDVRHVILIGEAGSGKSSIINLITDQRRAPVNNDAGLCTTAFTGYRVTLQGQKYILWDTPGLDGRPSELLGGTGRRLEMFLRTRFLKQELHLLVYCFKAGRSKSYTQRCYDRFCLPTRNAAAPVVFAVTCLEGQQPTMDSWWDKNGSALVRQGMDCDGHACITALSKSETGVRALESRAEIRALITRKYVWQPAGGEGYFADGGCTIA